MNFTAPLNKGGSQRETKWLIRYGYLKDIKMNIMGTWVNLILKVIDLHVFFMTNFDITTIYENMSSIVITDKYFQSALTDGHQNYMECKRHY